MIKTFNAAAVLLTGGKDPSVAIFLHNHKSFPNLSHTAPVLHCLMNAYEGCNPTNTYMGISPIKLLCITIGDTYSNTQA